MKTLIQKTLLAASLSALTMTSAFAANQGALDGTDSTGTADIDFTIDNEIQVNGLSDITLTGIAGAVRTGNTDLCVYTNSAVGYNMTATGSGTASAFEITDGTTVLSYTVEFEGTGLTSGTATATQTDQDTAATCSAATGNVVVNVAAVDADAAGAGVYAGTLTLVVAPE